MCIFIFKNLKSRPSLWREKTYCSQDSGQKSEQGAGSGALRDPEPSQRWDRLQGVPEFTALFSENKMQRHVMPKIEVGDRDGPFHQKR